jgi:hypothetical protein
MCFEMMYMPLNRKINNKKNKNPHGKEGWRGVGIRRFGQIPKLTFFFPFKAFPRMGK